MKGDLLQKKMMKMVVIRMATMAGAVACVCLYLVEGVKNEQERERTRG